MLPDRRFFKRVVRGVRTHHVHVVEENGRYWKRYLKFRDQHEMADLQEVVAKETGTAAEIHHGLMPNNPPRIAGYEVETLFKPTQAQMSPAYTTSISSRLLACICNSRPMRSRLRLVEL